MTTEKLREKLLDQHQIARDNFRAAVAFLSKAGGEVTFTRSELLAFDFEQTIEKTVDEEKGTTTYRLAPLDSKAALGYLTPRRST